MKFRISRIKISIIMISFLFFLSFFSYPSLEAANKINPESSNEFISVIVQFSKKPHNYKKLIKDLEGDIIHDYDIIEGVAIKIPKEKIKNLYNIENVLKIYEDKKVKALLHESAPMISADKVWDKGITGKDVKVCILDTGLDYTHPAFGSCSIYLLNGTTEPYVLESAHPYPANYNYTWTITKPGYTNIAVHFVTIALEVEDGVPYDFIYIKDANGTTVQTFTGWETNVWSVSVPGDTIKINLVNLVSGTIDRRYGFYMDKVLNGTVSVSYENCSKVVAGYDFMDNDSDPMDDSDHGTHVTGIVTSDDEYYRGIANGTKILAGKVLNPGGGTYSSVIAGIDWCVNNSAQIISMSLGGASYPGTCDDDALAQAVNNATEKGIPVVVSSGNQGMNGLTTPACASGAIAVGSVDKVSDVAATSSKGPELDLVAPGRWIMSAVPGGWDTKSGTSMAAPHVAGVIALMLEETPELSINDIRIVLNETSDPVNRCYECEWDEGYCMDYYEIECTWNVTGAGIVNASRAVESIGSGCVIVKVQYQDGCPRSGADVLIHDYPDPGGDYYLGITDEDGKLINCNHTVVEGNYSIYAIYPLPSTQFGPDTYLYVNSNGDGTTIVEDDSNYPNGTESCGDSECTGMTYCDSGVVKCDSWDTECYTKKCCQCDGGTEAYTQPNYDETQDEDCGLCKKCSALDTCSNVTLGTDPKNDCIGNCDYCDGSGNCVGDDSFCIGNCGYCYGSGNNYTCTPNEIYCDKRYKCSDCTGSGTSFSCSYDETEDEDCDFFDLSGIATCDNDPDAYHFTWDYRNTFDSQCIGLDQCSQGNPTITHTCNDNDLMDTVTDGLCDAECDGNDDCTSGVCLNDCTCKAGRGGGCGGPPWNRCTFK